MVISTGYSNYVPGRDHEPLEPAIDGVEAFPHGQRGGGRSWTSNMRCPVTSRKTLPSAPGAGGTAEGTGEVWPEMLVQ